jgi:hypothetical protein
MAFFLQIMKANGFYRRYLMLLCCNLHLLREPYRKIDPFNLLFLPELFKPLQALMSRLIKVDKLQEVTPNVERLTYSTFGC